MSEDTSSARPDVAIAASLICRVGRTHGQPLRTPFTCNREIVLDSEWHGLLACDLGAAARRRFIMESGISVEAQRHVFDEHRLEVCALVRLVALARSDATVLDGLARFAAALESARAGVFRSLPSRVLTAPEP